MSRAVRTTRIPLTIEKPPIPKTGGFVHTRQNNCSVAYLSTMGDCCNTKPASREKPVFTVMLNLGILAARIIGEKMGEQEVPAGDYTNANKVEGY